MPPEVLQVPEAFVPDPPLSMITEPEDPLVLVEVDEVVELDEVVGMV